MKILWVNNIAIPKIAVNMGTKTVPVGGWMVKLADEISAVEDNELHIMFPYHKNVNGKVDGISYTGFSVEKGNGLEFIKDTISNVRPDVVHIFGTESIHSYEVARSCLELGMIDKVAVSIQGMVSIYSMHYTAFLPHKVVVGHTLRDVLKGNVLHGQKRFKKLGESELKTLKIVKHVIGRTDWDRAVTTQVNPEAEYHFNNEMLRDSFYKNQWNIDVCERYSIFCSQATSPIKGLHLVVEAVSLLKKKYPQVHLYIAGKSYYEKPKYMLSYYEKYILKRIKELELRESVTFTGFLNEEQMCEQYLKTHVFVSPSSIENSPNSVCEAMILGMPVVSSFVGGVVNLIEHGVNGYFYQADAPYMLAEYVSRIFNDDNVTKRLGQQAHKTALHRHNVGRIIDDLMKVYSEMGGEKFYDVGL